MYAEVHNGLRDAQQIEATRVVVYDDYDNPIAVVVQMENGRYVAATAVHKSFKNILQAMGITKTAIVTSLNPATLQPLV